VVPSAAWIAGGLAVVWLSVSNAPALAVPPPGAGPRPPQLQARLEAALAAMPADYEPRTEHLDPDGQPLFLNRLVLETSPYLRQHAHNPVDWFPWGEEAFERARAEDKPVFLSIGYSTCHWCHVMERESFDNVEVARLMNELFVCIKVDREQRPDIDDIYMTAVQVTQQRGGWPMSSFLLPDRRPFFGATYFPPQQFVNLMRQVDAAWRERRADLEASAAQITDLVQQITAARGAAKNLGRAVIGEAVQGLVASTDRVYGGFGGAPKFPNETNLLLLLEEALRTGDRGPLDAALITLRAMARGGIHDQVGGGFHRYSVDGHWLVPHFEKMLYNQAHLLRAYVLAYRLTGDPLLARVARETADYVLRDMTSPEGAFYSATDADSEAEDGESLEGEFFVWTKDQLREALGPAGAELAIRLFGVTDAGNFEHRNILFLDRPLDESATDFGLPLGELLDRIDGIRERLYQVREHRPHPLRDDKVLTSWNGMMIRALAEAAAALAEPSYAEAAARAAEFLWRNSRRDDGGLWRVWLDGEASTPGLVQDYAHLVHAFVALHDVTSDGKWLEGAATVAAEMVERFWDPSPAPAGEGAPAPPSLGSGFFIAEREKANLLIAQPKSPTDGAVPSGNSVAVRALAELGHRTGDRNATDRALATVAAFATNIERMPAAYTYMLTGLAVALEGDAGPRATAGNGAVIAAAAALRPGDDAGEYEVDVDLVIREGWHLNGPEPLQEDLIGTTVEGAGNRFDITNLRYPEPRRTQVSTQSGDVLIYEGRQRITFMLRPSISGPEELPVSVPISIRLQACDDQLCLLPETVVLEVPLGTPLPGGRVSTPARPGAGREGPGGL
ncbi:MAG: thioredoxin domain-containing protein, partial [Holophagales bacterium]|nr:thioredoxin domain-containing protein [Holophagales bacterium]